MNMRIGLAQFSGAIDPAVNIRKVTSYTHELAEQGAEIICFQEMATTIYFCLNEFNPDYFRWAEAIPGPATEQVARLAQEHRIAIVFPMFERENSRFFNTAVFIDEHGTIVGRYRKVHIGVDPCALGAYSNERVYFTPGSDFRVYTLKGVRVGCLTCYDRHFPEAARTLALQGAELVFVPTATSGGSQPFWKAELIAHAAQNGFYVAGLNRVGPDEQSPAPDEVFYGSSTVVAPDGSTIAEMADDDEGTLVADIDISKVQDWRVSFGVLRELQPHTYAIPVGQSPTYSRSAIEE